MQRGEQQFLQGPQFVLCHLPPWRAAPRGEWDYELKGVYVIGILNFVFHESPSQVSSGEKSCLLSESVSDCFHHQVQLVDLKTKEVFYDKLTFIYLEMPKFNKTEAELETMFDKWMFVLRNLSGLLERPSALQDRVFNRLFKAAEIAAFSPQRRSEYWGS